MGATPWEARPLRAHPNAVSRRGVEQWQLVGLITQRSEVRILPPLPYIHLCVKRISFREVRFALTRNASG